MTNSGLQWTAVVSLGTCSGLFQEQPTGEAVLKFTCHCKVAGTEIQIQHQLVCSGEQDIIGAFSAYLDDLL